MKKCLLVLLLASASAFAGNSDIGSSNGSVSLECVISAVQNSNDGELQVGEKVHIYTAQNSEGKYVTYAVGGQETRLFPTYIKKAKENEKSLDLSGSEGLRFLGIKAFGRFIDGRLKYDKQTQSGSYQIQTEVRYPNYEPSLGAAHFQFQSCVKK